MQPSNRYPENFAGFYVLGCSFCPQSFSFVLKISSTQFVRSLLIPKYQEENHVTESFHVGPKLAEALNRYNSNKNRQLLPAAPHLLPAPIRN